MSAFGHHASQPHAPAADAARRLVAQATGIASMAAGLIHISAAADHANLPVMQAGFLVVAVLQGALGVWLLLGRNLSRLQLVGALGLMLGSVQMWMMSRTIGLPFLPGGHMEPIGFKDGVTVLFELASVPGLLLLMTRELAEVRLPSSLGVAGPRLPGRRELRPVCPGADVRRRRPSLGRTDGGPGGGGNHHGSGSGGGDHHGSGGGGGDHHASGGEQGGSKHAGGGGHPHASKSSDHHSSGGKGHGDGGHSGAGTTLAQNGGGHGSGGHHQSTGGSHGTGWAAMRAASTTLTVAPATTGRPTTAPRGGTTGRATLTPRRDMATATTGPRSAMGTMAPRRAMGTMAPRSAMGTMGRCRVTGIMALSRAMATMAPGKATPSTPRTPRRSTAIHP